MLLCLPIVHILVPPILFVAAIVGSLGFFSGIYTVIVFTCDGTLVYPWTLIKRGAEEMWKWHKEAIEEVEHWQ